LETSIWGSRRGRDPSTGERLDWWCKCFGNKLVLQIDEDDVDDGLLQLENRLTDSTINRYKSTLSAVFIYFIRHPKYKKLARHTKYANPVRKESVAVFQENPPKERFLDQQEQRVLLENFQKSSWDRLYLLVLMALTTGARKGGAFKPEMV